MKKLQCPKCSGQFQLQIFKEAISGFECQSCKGVYLNLKDLDVLPKTEEKTASSPQEIAMAPDNQKAIIDPISGMLMQKFRFQSKPPRFVEYSYLSSRVWLDQGELEALDQIIGLVSLRNIFSDAFQKKLREEQLDTLIEDKYRTLLGEKFQTVKTLKDSIQTPKELGEIITYLKA